MSRCRTHKASEGFVVKARGPIKGTPHQKSKTGVSLVSFSSSNQTGIPHLKTKTNIILLVKHRPTMALAGVTLKQNLRNTSYESYIGRGRGLIKGRRHGKSKTEVSIVSPHIHTHNESGGNDDLYVLTVIDYIAGV